MDATVRTPVLAGAVLLSLCLGWTATLIPARAQLMPNNAPLPEEPGLALDTNALLTDDRVFETSIDSHIWKIEALAGRRLIQIPIIVTPKSETTRLATPSLKLRGGRFIAWRIVPDESADTPESSAAYGSNDPYANPLSIGSLRDLHAGDLSPLDRPGQPTNTAERTDVAGPGESLSEETPVLARDIEVSPQGVIRWKLERAIPGAEVKTGDTGYLLKLRPDRLAELEPQRPERSTRQPGGERLSAEDAREAAARRRTEELEFREKLDAYRELRNQVRDLPDEFQTVMPSRVWAIYETPDRIDELSFTGDPPMPWRVDLTNLEALKQIASRTGVGNELTAADFTNISQMTLMLEDGHPLTQRAVADTLAASGMLGQAQQGDALYRLIDKLLRGGDPQAARTTTAGLAAAVPPTPATMSLLRGAFDQMDPGSKLLALGGLLTTEGSDPIGQRQMIETANQMIADPKGPGVVYVLQQLVQALADKPDAVTLVGAGIRFDALDESALDQAIIYIAEAAGDSALASEWMEHGLLGSTNTPIVKRTVELLGTSSAGNGVVTELTRAMILATFGPADADTMRLAKPRLHGIARIPIDSAGHSIYRVLNAGDPELRSLGWKAMKHFQVTAHLDGRYGASPTEPEAGDAQDRLTLILNAALQETVTPAGLVMFLVNQQDAQPATAALVRIVVEGRGPAITQASRALVRSGRPLAQPIQALSSDQRGMFAVRLYEAVTGSAPMVAGLMRVPDAQSPIVNWFTQQVATLGLPEPAQWAQAARGEDELLSLAAGGDPELADAAVAALVASVGGDELAARDLARRMSNATDRSPTGMRQQWSAAKQELYAAKLKHAAGNYRLIVNLRGQASANLPGGYPGGYGEYGEFDEGGYGEYPATPAPSLDATANLPLIASINVALIELKADGQSLSLASGTLTLAPSDARLAIAIQQPNELKDFGNEELNKLPLESIQGPIELLPQKGNVWRGAATLSDSRTLEVVFDPE